MTLRVYEATSSTLKFLNIVSRDRIEEAERELERRYNDCDKNSHGVFKENRCQHCYRHQEYEPLLVELIKKTEPMIIPSLPIDATDAVANLTRDKDAIELLRIRDYEFGIEKILEDLP